MQVIDIYTIHYGVEFKIPMGGKIIDWDAKKDNLYISHDGAVQITYKRVVFMRVKHRESDIHERGVPNGFAHVATDNGNSLFMRG